MTTHRSLAPLSLALVASLQVIACGARTDLAGGAAAGGAGATSGESSSTGAAPPDTSATSTASVSSTSESASSGIPFVQCGCPDDPGYVDCAAPLDCCACNDDGLGWTVDRCEDPATFNCTCGDPLSCLGG